MTRPDPRFEPPRHDTHFESARFEPARKVADTVLYEGYILYPYRASAQKNQLRWQFGVLAPRGYCEAADPSEHWASQTEVLVESSDATTIHVEARFLQARARTVEQAVEGVPDAFRPVPTLTVGDTTISTWDEGLEQEAHAEASLAELLASERTVPFAIPGSVVVEPILDSATDASSQPVGQPVGRIVRTRWPIAGLLRLTAERLDGPYGLTRLRVRLENVTAWDDPSAPRDEALRRSLVSAHLLLGLSDSTFVSLLEPPEWAQPAAASCQNLHTWPVMIGDRGRRDLMLSSPIVLYDYPEIAPESPGDLFDATEIDEILTLRTMALTDAEKREARGTDARAAAILNRVDAMPREILDRLHGAVRYLRQTTTPASIPTPEVPWWDPGADASVSPETDFLLVGSVAISKGSRVRLRPGRRRADAQDMFLEGRTATVQAVYFDVDNGEHLAVALDDDPAADLFSSHGRFLYFAPDEVEPLESGA